MRAGPVGKNTIKQRKTGASLFHEASHHLTRSQHGLTAQSHCDQAILLVASTQKVSEMSRILDMQNDAVRSFEPDRVLMIGHPPGLNGRLSTLSARELRNVVERLLNGRQMPAQEQEVDEGWEVVGASPGAGRPGGRPIAVGGLATWQITKVQAHVRHNLANELRVEDLAALCRLSTSQFHRSFKQSINMTPYAYILRERMRLACELLRETDLPLSHIALDCGMSDQSHLSNVFRRHIGATPFKWRRQYRRASDTGTVEARSPRASPPQLSLV